MSNFTDIEKKRIEYLDECSVWCERDESGCWELEMYTPADCNMYWYLKELTPECLQEYIDNFDINEEVIFWWQGGTRGTEVPYANIRDHYNDVEEWLNELQNICNDMPTE